MKVVRVIPISRGMAREELSYFSSRDVAEGSVVSVNLRGKNVPAIVSGVKDAKEIKSELRSAKYKLKKIGPARGAKVFLPEFIEAAREGGDYFATTTGAILNSVAPKHILSEPSKVKMSESLKTHDEAHEKFIFQADESERFARYRGIIRESFAKGSSVCVIAPSSAYAEKLSSALGKGIEDRSFMLHAVMPKQKFIEEWKEAIKHEGAILIVATSQGIGLPRKDIGTFIVDGEHSSKYKSQSRPFLDIRTFAEIYTKRLRAKLIFGDMLLRVETLWRFRQLEFIELARPKLHYLSKALPHLTDMSKEKHERTKELPVAGKALKKTLAEVAKSGRRKMFVFAARRGIAGSTVCRDCGNIFTCKSCQSPITLHGKDGGTVYLCHKCLSERDSMEKCDYCGSWNLIPLGIGIEKVVEEIRKAEPRVEVFRLDSDIAKTAKKAKSIVDGWKETPHSVLVGTEMALPYIDSFDYGVIASIDSLFSLPDFKISEKVFNIILTIRNHSESGFIIQTRNKENEIITNAMDGNVIDFYRNEIKTREELGFPPFTTFIKLSIKGTKQSVKKAALYLDKKLEGYDFDVFPAFTPMKRGAFQLRALISIPRGKWIDRDLLETIRSLPPSFSVDVEPENTF